MTLKLFERMPFGKHRGIKLKDIETSYLQWCLDNIKFTGNTLKTSIEYEILNREAHAINLTEKYAEAAQNSDDVPF